MEAAKPPAVTSAHELLPEVVTALREGLEWPGLAGSRFTLLWKAVPKSWQSIIVS